MTEQLISCSRSKSITLRARINFHLYHNRLITDAQYGFVKGRYTELQLLNCSKMWINAIDYNKFVDTVYIDFSKAFDTVSHRKLLHKLTNYRITGNILQWFSSFLCDRKQRVTRYTFLGMTDQLENVQRYLPDVYTIVVNWNTNMIIPKDSFILN